VVPWRGCFQRKTRTNRWTGRWHPGISRGNVGNGICHKRFPRSTKRKALLHAKKPSKNSVGINSVDIIDDVRPSGCRFEDPSKFVGASLKTPKAQTRATTRQDYSGGNVPGGLGALSRQRSINWQWELGGERMFWSETGAVFCDASQGMKAHRDKPDCGRAYRKRATKGIS